MYEYNQYLKLYNSYKEFYYKIINKQNYIYIKVIQIKI